MAKKAKSKTSKKEETPKKKAASKRSKASKRKSKKSKATSPKTNSRAASFLKQVTKTTPDAYISLEEFDETEPKPHIPSGSLVIDYLIGGTQNGSGIPICPGFPRGGIVEIYGPEGSGKSTIAQTAAGVVAGFGGLAVYIDWEHVLAPDYAESLGVPTKDPERFLLFQPNTLEEGFKIAWAAAKNGVDLIVFDSIGAGVPQEIFGQKDEDIGHLGRLGLVSAKWSHFLPKLQTVVSQSKSTVIGIAQMRANISTGPGAGYGKKTKPQGGTAWKFFSWVRVDLRRVQTLKEKVYSPLSNSMEEQVVGSKIRVTMEKCKVSPHQGRYHEIYIRQGEGIDNVSTVIDIASKNRIIKKGGSWYSWVYQGQEVKVQGTSGLREILLENKEMQQALSKQVLACLTATGSDELSDDVEEDVDDIFADSGIDD